MTPRLELRASPDLLAYAELLALPAVELEHVVEQELAQNPALDRLEEAVCPFCGEPVAGARCLLCRQPAARPDTEPAEAGAMPAQLTAAELLLEDLRPLLPPRRQRILEYLVGCLDERGFLDATPEEVAVRLDCGRAEVDAVLEVLRREGPPGVAASGLRDSLLLQLERLPDDDLVALARAIVADHLEELAAGRLRAIAAALGVEHDEVAAAADLIRTRLRPSAMPDPPNAASPALPDVIVRRADDAVPRFVIELVEPRRLRLSVSPEYAHLDAHALDADTRAAVDWQLASARAFLHRLDRRWKTMRAIAEVVVERQHEFLLRGPRFAAPLTRADVAAEVGVHESTVSRATAGRYVLLPNGRLVPFSRFFDAAQAPCAALAQLVADETAPRSDSELADDLLELGFRVARRTVAKYRTRLGIAPHTER
ncbi:MAG TPA: hypothetical protein VF101_01070 [Gaiellaceae bacterium]